MKRLLLAAAVVCVPLALAAASWTTAATKPTKFQAALNVGQEVPHPKGTKVGASGHFTATYSNGVIKWTLSFGHLTGAATAAHIHNGVKGKAGPVVAALCGPCTSGAKGQITGETAASIATAMGKGRYYVNVHTAKNPSGEIRGQVTVVH